jgi:hypothetical protein
MVDPPVLLEFQQINEYLRHETGVYFAWFTFFLTILFGAMGWSLKAALGSDGTVRFPAVFFCMLFLFLVQIGLAIIATNVVLADVAALKERLATLLVAMPAEPIEGYSPAVPVPGAYEAALRLARWALIVNLTFWPIVGGLVYWRYRRKAPIASPAVEGAAV